MEQTFSIWGSIKRSFPVAAVWFGILCGPSMASGVYATTYFCKWGGWSWAFILVFMLLTGIGCFFSMRFCQAYQLYTYAEFFQELYTPKFYKVLKYPLDIYTVLGGIIAESAQLALGASIFASLFGWHPVFGAAVMAVIIVALMLWGDEFVRKGCTYMTYFLIFGFILILYYTINIRGGVIAQYIGNFDIYTEWNGAGTLGTGLWAVVAYAWGQMCPATSLCPVMRPMTDKRDVISLSILGPVLVGILFVVTSVITIGYAPESLAESTPILYAVTNYIAPVAKWVTVIYYILMFFALFTSGPALTLGQVVRWRGVFFKKNPDSMLSTGITAVGFNIICVIISTLGLTALCAKGFTLLGKIAFPLIVLPMLLTTYGRASHKYQEREEAQRHTAE